MQKRIRTIGDGLGEILDGDVLRVGMADSKTSRQPLRMTDGTDDLLALHRPGFRIERGGNIGDVLVRDGARRDRAEQYALYDAEQENAYKNTSPSWSSNPPTGQGEHGVPGVEDIPEGQECTINGWPGTWQRVSGTMTCVPNNRRADSLSCYDIYDLQAAEFSARHR